ncbi:MAG TPA: hypothetical protein VH083_22795, partial [Myxococcales bacterium]|nr:hypothetical protein [Myxococcales bacterium]
TQTKSAAPGSVATLSPSDYLFSAARAGGPWSKEIAAPANAKEQAQQLFIGLEICADHNFSTVKKLSEAVRKDPFLDLHLLPSAGMSINTSNLGNRKDGFIFNCDGWNANQNVTSRNGAIVQVDIGGGAPAEAGKNPLKPHSELIRRTDTGFAAVTTPTRVKLTDDVERIFGYGPGELHIYDPQPLP